MNHYTPLSNLVFLLLVAGLSGMMVDHLGLSAIVSILAAGIGIRSPLPPFLRVGTNGPSDRILARVVASGMGNVR